MTDDVDHLRDWVGRTETSNDISTSVPLKALAATLDRAEDEDFTGGAVPPLWHWLYFLPIAAQSQIGPDGHPKRGGFLPPVPLPRRMWAGSDLQFHAPLHEGQALKRISRISDVRRKTGRSGELVFVDVDHSIHADGKLCISERHNIVYRGFPEPGEVSPKGIIAPVGAQWSTRIDPDPVLLFRYSALTFNGHRIHYDRSYVTQVEGYPGLVVHGPLIATLLLELLHRSLPQAQVASFSFKAIRPLFDTSPFFVCGRQDDVRTVKLWAQSEEGFLTMDATAILH